MDSNSPQSRASQLLIAFRSQPEQFDSLIKRYPKLHEALQNQNLSEVVNALHQIDQDALAEKQAMIKRRLAAESDPFSVESQLFFEEEINRQKVLENWALAQEHLPEAFATVQMLYIAVELNGHFVRAFIDSGAQATILSKKTAEYCCISRLIDTRYEGMAKGVGTAKIVGKIHMAPLKIGKNFYPTSFTVLEETSVELLFGLDMLRSHQCCIDLKKNCLSIGDNSVDFLAETETRDLDPANMTNNATSSTEPTSNTNLPSNEEKKNTNESPKTTSSVATPSDALQRLMNFGFSQLQATQALEMSEGNEDLAASLLFQQFDA